MLKNIIRKMVGALGYELRKKDVINTYYQIDSLFNELYREAMIKTQMESSDNELRRQRHYVLNHLLTNVDLRDGDICEVGCWRGLSAYQIANYVKFNDLKVIFHIFDSFEGLSQIEPIDKYNEDKRKPENVRKQFACSLEEVQYNLREFDFIHFYKGWIPERFSEVANKRFSFVHIDVDLYQPTYDSFQFFYPRLIRNGLIVFDDYGCAQFPGAKKAIDECIAVSGDPFFIALPSGQAFLIRNQE